MDDRALLTRARAGDRAAGEAFASRHLDAMLRYARVMTGDPVRAEDVVQDVLVAVLRGASDPEGEDARSWLIVATRHGCHRLHRRRSGEPVVLDALDTLGAAAGWGADPEQLASAHEDGARIEAALGMLPEEDREIIVLRDLEGLDGAATAAELGLSVAAMKSRLHRARLRLMAALREGGAHGT